MLLLLTGQDRVQLSKEIFERICKDAKYGISGQILIVPEQFSHEAERMLCQLGGETISRYAEVLSLSRMSDRLAACYGGAAQAYLDKGGQLLTMAYAAEQVGSRMKLFSSVIRKPEFLADMVRMIGEFRSYCLEPQMLLEAASRTEGQFSQKLEELAILYEAYLAVCKNGKADPSDKLFRLQSLLCENLWANGRKIYVNGFSDFTESELVVLEQLMEQADQLVVSIATMSLSPSLEHLSNNTIMDLEMMAARKECRCEKHDISGRHSRDSQVQYLLDHLFCNDVSEPRDSERIVLRSFDAIEQECRSAILQIKSWLQKGARCRDISIACADYSGYSSILREQFRIAKLPVYFAGEKELLDHPVVHGVLAALQAASGSMEYEEVSDYIKSWLPQLDRESCDCLDNYAFRWNLMGRQWEQPWTLHPRGYGELWTEEDQRMMDRLNASKELALRPLLNLREQMQRAKNTGEMVLALYGLLEQLQIQSRLEEKSAQLLADGDGQASQTLAQIYEVLCQAMEQIWLIVGDTVRIPEDFFRLFKLLLTQYEIGTIPAGLDQIHVSDLPDLRNRNTRHLLILGCQDGNLPAYRTSDGILTEDERQQLVEQGLTIAPCRADQMDQEMGRIAAVFAAAEETVWMSYAGEQPAWLFRRAVSLYPNSMKNETEPVFLDLVSLAAWRLRENNQTPLQISGLETVEETLRSLRAYSFAPLDQATVHGLYGREIYLSASRIDKYASCRFAFFLAYGLKALPRKRAVMDPSVFGTFVHAVLEQVVRRVMAAGGFRTIPEEQLLSIAMEEIDAYASVHFPEQAQRAAYLFRRSQDEILDIVLDLGEELKYSLFQPVCCELEFSSQGLLPSIEVRGKDAVCQISGFVDRVDLYEEGDRTYVRVVDYKTGKKDFDYTDILNGAGLQMLVYLFALRQYGGELFRRDRLEPAGVLYLPARKGYALTAPMPDEDTVTQEHLEERRRKGLIRGDSNLLAAMEADPENPRFMPYEVGKKGIKGDIADSRQMILLERHVLRTLADMTDQISGGSVVPNPVVRGQNSSCRFCDYAAVCHKDLNTHQQRVLAATSAEHFWEKLEQEEVQHG